MPQAFHTHRPSLIQLYFSLFSTTTLSDRGRRIMITQAFYAAVRMRIYFRFICAIILDLTLFVI